MSVTFSDFYTQYNIMYMRSQTVRRFFPRDSPHNGGALFVNFYTIIIYYTRTNNGTKYIPLHYTGSSKSKTVSHPSKVKGFWGGILSAQDILTPGYTSTKLNKQ